MECGNRSLLKEQDQELDKLHDGVKRVKALGGVMRDELSECLEISERRADTCEAADCDRADTCERTERASSSVAGAFE